MANPASGDKKNIVKLAYLYFQEGRWDSAIEEYKKLIELDPEDTNVHNMLGDVYVKKNASAEAYEEYSKVSTDLVNRGQLDKALLINKKIARLDKNQLSVEAQQKQNLIQLHMQADEALEGNRVEEAMSAFGEILKLDSEDLIVASKLAELEEKIGRIPDAVEQYMRLGDAFLKSHLFKKAQEMFKKVVVMDPQNTGAHLNLAQIYTKQGSENDAKKEYLNIAEQALSQEDLDGAFEYANKAVELKSIEAHYIVGIVLFKRQKFAESKVEFDNLLRFKINHSGAQVYLAKVYAELEQSDKAVDAFQKALKIDKDNFFTLESWAEYCVKKKNTVDAVKTLSILIDKSLVADNFTHAIEFAKTMVSLDEKAIASKLKLAEVLQASGDSIGTADVYYNLALIYENEGKTDESAQYIKKALEKNPNHEKALAISSRNLQSNSPVPTVAIEIEKPVAEDRVVKNASKASFSETPKEPVVQVSPQEALKAQMGIADQYVKQGLLDEAIDIYQQLLETNPDNAEVKQKLNTVYAAYAKTGTDLTSVFAPAPKEESKKADEGAMPAKKDIKELEAKAREEAEGKVREEEEKKARFEAEKKARDEADKKARVELEKRAREEAEKKANEEIKRLADEKSKKSQESAASAKSGKLPLMGELDGMFALAEADLLHSQGKNEEALKLYQSILTAHPNNEEVRKKLSALESFLKSKTHPLDNSQIPPNLKVAESPVSHVPTHPVDTKKDSNIKKKSNKIGYV